MLVPPGDAQTLAAAVCSLIRDPARSERLGLAARRRVSERFSLQHSARLHLALFERLRSAAAR
jgi:glycosyltransferase involved in cell wall biosynthesis